MAKVLLVHPGCYIGGGGKGALTTAQMLRELGYEVEILNSTYSRDMFKCFSTYGYKCIEHDGLMGVIMYYSGAPKVLSRTFINALIKIPKTKKVVMDSLLKGKHDIVIVNSIVLSWLSMTLKKNGIKSVCFVRETGKKGFITFIMKKMLEKFNGVLFISEYDKEYFNLKGTKTGVIRDCVNIEDYSVTSTKGEACKRLNIPTDTYNILFVGGTNILKGWEVILRAFSSLNNENFRLIVAGYADEEKLPKDDRIHYIGIRTDMPYVYSACDVLVLPSTEPHQLMPVFEAGFMKLPIIISKFEQTQHVITNMVNGLDFNPEKVEELENAIMMLFNDKELRENISRNNYTLVTKVHEFNYVKSDLENYIDNL